MTGRRLFLFAAGAALWASLLGGSAEAHGGSINVGVTCVSPDPARPLARVCTAALKYLDGDPVLRARVVMIASREGGPTLAAIPSRPADEDGVYLLSVTLPAYGNWRMRFEMLEPGRGTARLEGTLLPPLPGTAPEIQSRLQVVVRFGLVDIWNLAARILHLAAAMLWFGLIALVLVLSRLSVAEPQHALKKLSAVFPWLAGGSLLVVSITGIYNARYSTPAPPPGLLAPQALSALPYGRAYLAVFVIKMILTVVIVLATATLALVLRRRYGTLVAAISGGSSASGRIAIISDRWVSRLAAGNLVIGLLTFVAVVVLGYLHVIVHLAGAAGTR